ncbi:MAG TPA: glutamine--tRNA ligase/YqeY domain fusion protein [Ignavibacteriales bacterium]|nr:glutamine--tRNA ligase/YqeY domain fusion protein [Ignavibacteriales bacterium]HPP32900.1 glutamine--tRNA ligase/YqeY domain fusion protein [Ignavibacteriales bacterium]
MENEKKQSNFIREIIDEDLKKGKNNGRVHTRFPPEPNGYLHIGHAKSICLNFGIARDYNGKCNLRFDDTNPTKEDVEYVESIKEDIRWLGFQWDNEFYASDYFEQLYEWAEYLIKKGKAYVCDLSPEQVREYRGTPTEPGKESPYRNRSVEENLDLFRRMRAGEFPEGSKTLRAKIDMASPNLNMRDPVMYRIIYAEHHRTGNKWCIYPMYDWAHGQSDAIEGITHSICTLEFENHRPLYDWFLDNIQVEHHPQQIEFARLNLNYTVMSKRKLLQLVTEGYVDGWDDPRMPTISGLRRRGYTPESIRNFADMIGVAKRDNIIDMSLLEYCIREDLNKRAQRAFAVLNPVKVIIDNLPDNHIEYLEAVNNPEDPESGKRKIPFTKELYIEQDDFMENPPDKYFRLTPNQEVRLKYAYIIKFKSLVKDPTTGEILEIHCEYDPDTKSGENKSNKKVKAAIHWLSANHCADAEIRLYDRLFKVENPDDVEEGKTFLDYLNPDSLKVIKNAKVEPWIKDAKIFDKYQFERLGYFSIDKYSTSDNLIINRTVTLKDTWAKIQNKNK